VILKLLSYNIRFGGSGREPRLAEVIRAVSPDLVVFQEATDTRVIEGLAKAVDFPYWAAQRAHSIAYLSRVEISYHEWHYPAGAKHSFLEIVPAGTEARIFGLHLSSMFSKWSERRRAREISALLRGIERHQHGFHVLVGDFNTLAPGEVLDARRMPGWIRALVWMSGRDIQRETIQIMLDANYVDGFRLLHPEVKGYTFPTWDPHLRLDYVFVPKPFAERLPACEVITSAAEVAEASDHFPLLALLEI
jgi:endonuclease/exonuclease/phosphatase family metal-dependent hydrolase